MGRLRRIKCIAGRNIAGTQPTDQLNGALDALRELTLSPEARGQTRELEARRLVRDLLEQAARLAICPLDLRKAIDAELGAPRS